MIKKEILKHLIRDMHTQPLPARKPRLLRLPIGINKIITVTGVRRSGKTSLLLHTMAELISSMPRERILYINFEDERLNLDASELDLIIQSYRELYPEMELSDCHFFFDEIHIVPQWKRLFGVWMTP